MIFDDDIEFRYSIDMAFPGLGDSLPQPDPADSLGGYISTTEWPNSTKHSLFDKLTLAEDAALQDQYRCIFVLNKGIDIWKDVRIWVPASVAGGADVYIAHDTFGVREKGSGPGRQCQAVSPEVNAPLNCENCYNFPVCDYGSSGFVYTPSAVDYESGLIFYYGEDQAVVYPNDCFAVWIRRRPTASGTFSDDGFTLGVGGYLGP